MASAIHPTVDRGIQKGAESFAGGTLRCPSKDAGWDGPGFAAFVSSIIESGTPPSAMANVRQTLRDKGLEPYGCLSPALMDILSTQAAKAKGTYREA
ncbi:MULTISPECIES: hypothetical protein [Paraburkholderia]|uniref:Uncharacterized protein n=1 Tax=Paraburkholderia ferrariae TaxID=386056 RepID=A0ABU9RRJ1_9BURK